MVSASKQQVRVVPLGPGDESAFIAAATASRKLHAKWVSPPITRVTFRKKLKYLQSAVNLTYCVRRVDNDALVRAYGFKKEGYSPRYLKIRGRWRDHERWAILAS